MLGQPLPERALFPVRLLPGLSRLQLQFPASFHHVSRLKPRPLARHHLDLFVHRLAPRASALAAADWPSAKSPRRRTPVQRIGALHRHARRRSARGACCMPLRRLLRPAKRTMGQDGENRSPALAKPQFGNAGQGLIARLAPGPSRRPALEKHVAPVAKIQARPAPRPARRARRGHQKHVVAQGRAFPPVLERGRRRTAVEITYGDPGPCPHYVAPGAPG